MEKVKRAEIIKKLLYQSCNRGCKETDLIVGAFARENLEEMTPQELDIFSNILQLADADIYDWYTHKKPLPTENDTPLMQKLLNFSPLK